MDEDFVQFDIGVETFPHTDARTRALFLAQQKQIYIRQKQLACMGLASEIQPGPLPPLVIT
jgi:hypothetical protein